MRGCRPLARTERAAFLRAIRGPYELRDRALVMLGMCTGFRVSEMLALRMPDLFQNGRMVQRVTVARRSMKGKTSSRTVLLHPAAREALRAWVMEMIRAGMFTPDMPLFVSRRGDAEGRPQSINRKQAWRILEKAFARAGLEGRLGTHSLRKTFAAEHYEKLKTLAARGKPVDVLRTMQKLLAHVSIESTMSYLEGIDSAFVDEMILGMDVGVPVQTPRAA